MGLRRPLAFTVVFIGVVVASVVVFDDSKIDVEVAPQEGPPPTVVSEPETAIGILEGSSPFDLEPVAGADGPVLTVADVDDTVASDLDDPFVLRHDDGWLMFLTVRSEITRRDTIALARSDDGRDWTYDRLVLPPGSSRSHPQVFEHDDQWFMMVESASTGQVPLFRATEFPTAWEPVATLVQGRRYTDPTPFEAEGRWWMFVGWRPNRDNIVELFVADDPRGPWAQHPAGAVVEDDENIARPGGPVIRTDDGLYRLAEDADPRPTEGLRAFEITDLTPTTYAERPVDEEQILGIGSTSWADLGIGHLHAIEIAEGDWIGYVSGRMSGLPS